GVSLMGLAEGQSVVAVARAADLAEDPDSVSADSGAGAEVEVSESPQEGVPSGNVGISSQDDSSVLTEDPKESGSTES
ncbi:hypothetical protein N9D66_01490, partial [Candidatus Nanopelagicales bacterium]|nr:hypothetical protein [Candidatus Nanopelagicales bacterium]